MKGARFSQISNDPRLPGWLLTVVAVFLIALGITANATHLLKTLEAQTVDARFTIRGDKKAPSNYVLVKIDARTFRDLNMRFPFPHAVVGRVLRNIAKEKPAAIAVDVQLSEPGVDGQGGKDDQKLVGDIFATHGKAIFSETETTATGRVKFLGADGTKLLRQLNSQPASTLFPYEPGNFIRRVTPSINHLDTFAAVTAKVATGKTPPAKDYARGGSYIDFLGPSNTFASVPFSSVYGCGSCRKLPPDFFKGKVVVIGATAPSLQDFHPTPVDGNMSGPEIQLNAILTVVRGLPLSAVAGWINNALIVLMGSAIPLIALRISPLRMTGAAIGLGVAFAVAAQLLFNSGRVVTFVYPAFVLILSYLSSLAVRLVAEAFQHVRTRDLFSRFVPEDVVDEVLASADGLRLGGVQREGTVMFVDLRGFTSLAETLTPARVIDTLNHYLGEMSDAILNHGGTLVAYMGDGIMAVFGAPLAQDDHADRALAAAREMLTVRLPTFNGWLQSENLSEGFKMGIGLNSGNVMSGHVGSERRVEYTAVGDTTNTAARIEALTKGTEHMLLLSDATREALRAPVDDLQFVEEKEIRGRVGKIKLWSLDLQGAARGESLSARTET
jgi:adenylate cyclase